jgi:hypothetical protein
MICYYAGRSNVFQDAYGNLLFFKYKNFTYNEGVYTFDVVDVIHSVIYVTFNGLVEVEDITYTYMDNIVTIIDPLHQLQDQSSIIVAYLR